MNKQLLSISILLLPVLYSWAQEDPFKTINYGNDKVETIKANWVRERKFTDPEFENTSFKYLLNGITSDYPVVVKFNPDGYETDELRQLELDLNADEVINHNGKKFIYRARMARSIKDVNDILKIYYQYYGEPDSIIIPELSETIKSFNTAMGWSTESQERTYIWKEKNYQVSFYIPSAKRVDINDPELFYRGAEIKYSTINYEDNLFEIKEKIRRELTPSDIVEIWLREPNWIPSAHSQAVKGVYDFQYDIDMARKIAPEEERAIKAVKFDIVFIDSFKDEIARWKGINFQLPQPLDRYDYDYRDLGYEITYDSREKRALPLEIGRQMNKSSGITIKAEVTAILYTNGDLLKD